MLTHLLGRDATDEDVDRYLRRLDEGGPGVEVYPGIEGALEALHGRIPLAVYTGASTRAAELLLVACGLRGWFDLVVGADRVARPKPWPDGIELACLELGVPSKEAAYVGDAPADLEAARRSGALAVAAGWGHLYSPDEPADVVAATPADLVALVERGSDP
jgi:phosphoglycolate phosphatase/AHBA synthesis associated protein